MQAKTSSSNYKQLEQKSKYTNMFLRWFLYFVLILFASYLIRNKTKHDLKGIAFITWFIQYK